MTGIIFPEDGLLTVDAIIRGEAAKDPECVRREMEYRFKDIEHELIVDDQNAPPVTYRNSITLNIPAGQLNDMGGIEYGELFEAMHLFGIGLWDASDNCIK